ncbi:Holliday junction resolvase-like predicted endonuclease [Solirubrobacter pauli]|uniref:Holliday junction resolvase-like predicted endonuclease n=1 Tax=Solirubrobacter pauli TaxID=166793 RepID=A0A660L654_9ACTN|nr:hypothetical protein [Solirubrobacter pauli]RKQ90532.1 Holliday junction resolvase-like predicted endonuclease [Solirubrobacter pauli]
MDASSTYAAEHFQRLGFRILDHDRQTRFGLLSLVAYDGSVLVFAQLTTGEVDRTEPSLRERTLMRRRAAVWITDTPASPIGADLRFDAIHVRLDEGGALRTLDHSEGAF